MKAIQACLPISPRTSGRPKENGVAKEHTQSVRSQGSPSWVRKYLSRAHSSSPQTGRGAAATTSSITAAVVKTGKRGGELPPPPPVSPPPPPPMPPPLPPPLPPPQEEERTRTPKHCSFGQAEVMMTYSADEYDRSIDRGFTPVNLVSAYDRTA
jgi:hypothetical protein